MNHSVRNSTAASGQLAVAIFTDEPGWHGRKLRDALRLRGYDARFESLCRCGLDLADATPAVQIPAIDGLPAAAFVRGVAGGTLEEIVTRLNVLHGLQLLGIPVFNDGRAIERTVDKGLTSFLLRAHEIPTPRTWVFESVTAARAVAEREFRDGRAIVLKPLFGSQGNGVMQLDTIAAFDQHVPSTGVYYLQEYIGGGEADFRDWRVFVVGGRAVAGMLRRSSHWVTNRAQGAVCEPIGVDAKLFALAEAAAAALGVDYGGIDLLRDRDGHWLVSEVNGIPAWQGLQRASGVDITDHVVAAFVAKIESSRDLAATG